MKPDSRTSILQAVHDQVINVGKVVPRDAVLIPPATAFSEGLPFTKGMLYHGDKFEDKLHFATGLHVIGSGLIVLSRDPEVRNCVSADLVATNPVHRPILERVSGLSPEARQELAQQILEM